MINRRLRYNLIRFMRLKGAPGKLALGFAIGACVNFFPTFGFGIPLAGIVAGIVFANIPAGLLGDVIFKPLFPFFFYLNMVTGSFLWANQIQDVRHVWAGLLSPALLVNCGKIFFTGALVNSVILGVILYVFMFFIVERYRMTFLRRLISKNRRNRVCA
ncbi:DUF2062 domain-containing protein [Phosphitispora sp. TUW77]|uniref:DUF2062 domain-containing protein n=1 Tax=Phosphitispora sp. TUW77 TaxID=3152361 RepID=UPI003AB1BA78